MTRGQVDIGLENGSYRPAEAEFRRLGTGEGSELE